MGKDVSFITLKKWAGKKGFGIATKIGESKEELTEKLIQYMQENPEECTEEQLEWLESQKSQTGGKSKPKRAKKTEKAAKAKKAKAPEPEPDEVAFTKEELREYADELGIKYKKRMNDADYQELARKVYEEVDALDETDREELSEGLFHFYTIISGQVEDEGEPEAEAEPEQEVAYEKPSDIKLKRWSNLLGCKPTPEAILEAMDELDESDYDDLPNTLVDWYKSTRGITEEEPEEEAEEEAGEEVEFEMPDMRTLKAYGKAVGLKILHMKKAKTEEDLAEMILDAYDPEEEENYPPELIEFYQAMRGEEETEEPEEEAEEEVEEESEEKSQVYAWLIETGYEEEDISDLEEADLISLLKETYQDTDTREELPDEAVAYLKEHFPEMFPKPKKLSRKKKKIIRKK